MKVRLLVAAMSIGASWLHSESLSSGWWRGQPVTFEERDGWAVVEGDILLAPLGEIMNEPPPAGTVKRKQRTALVTEERYRWPGGVVPYRIDPALPNPQRVRDAIRSWMAQAPLQFVERTEETNFINVRRSTGCSATLGMRAGEQFINLEDSCTTTNTIHEIGHALGLLHTQSRSDRDRHLRILRHNIQKSQRVWFQLELAGSAELGPYDYGSVMHYARTAFSSNGLPAFETVPPGIPARAFFDPSPADFAAIKQAYGFPDDEITVTTHPPGLKILVDGVEMVGPKRFAWGTGERHVLKALMGKQQLEGQPASRFEFAAWSDQGGAEHEIESGSGTRVYTANFSQEFQVRTGTSGGAGTVRLEPPSSDGWYRLGTVLQVHPQPGPGLGFAGWFVLAGGAWAQGIFGRGLAQAPAEFFVDRENLTYVGRFVSTPVTRVTSTPPGLTVVVDGRTCTTPCVYEWTAGSAHTLDARDSNGFAGDRFVFNRWSSGSMTRLQTVTAGTQAATHLAEFGRKFRLAVNLRTRIAANSGNRPDSTTIEVTPDEPDRFYDAGQSVEIAARNGDGWQFGNWTGDLTSDAGQQPLVIREETVVTGSFLTVPFILNESVVHDATRQSGFVSPRQLLVIYCPELGVDSETEGQKNEQGSLPNQLGGWTVLFDDDPAEIVSIGPRAIRVITPASLAGKRSVIVTIRSASGLKGSVEISVVERNPAPYPVVTGGGPGYVAATNEDGSANSADTPASAGSVVSFLASGLGSLNESKLPLVLPAVRVGGRPAEVTSVEPAPGQPEGVFRISLRIPAEAGAGAVPLEFDGTEPTAPVTTIALR